MHPEQMRGWGLAPADAAAATECGARDFFAPDVAALAAATGDTASLQPYVPSLQPCISSLQVYVPRWRLATRDGQQLCRGRLRPARQVRQLYANTSASPLHQLCLCQLCAP